MLVCWEVVLACGRVGMSGGFMQAQEKGWGKRASSVHGTLTKVLSNVLTGSCRSAVPAMVLHRGHQPNSIPMFDVHVRPIAKKAKSYRLLRAEKKKGAGCSWRVGGACVLPPRPPIPHTKMAACFHPSNCP